jgi:Cu-processing system ATP-binding protein
VKQFDIWESGRQARQLVSYLPQRVAFPESLTAREVLSFYAQLRRMPSSRVEELLATPQFHFNGFSNKPVSQYSGGMVQRLGLAVACLPDAPILLLDEPTVSLDPEGAIRFREFLATLKRAGKTLLFSSHVLADVEQLADRVGIMVGGRLVALESISTLRESLMRGSRMRIELASSSQQYAEAACRAGAHDVECAENVVWITSIPEDRLQILRAIEAAGGEVLRFASQEPSLEDIYLQYISEQGAGHGH